MAASLSVGPCRKGPSRTSPRRHNPSCNNHSDNGPPATIPFAPPLPPATTSLPGIPLLEQPPLGTHTPGTTPPATTSLLEQPPLGTPTRDNPSGQSGASRAPGIPSGPTPDSRLPRFAGTAARARASRSARLRNCSDESNFPPALTAMRPRAEASARPPAAPLAPLASLPLRRPRPRSGMPWRRVRGGNGR